MKMKLILTSAVFALASAGQVGAAGHNNNGPTVGDCISDGFYGNEPNIVGPFAPGGPAEQPPGSKGGRVVPSQSPGPQVTDPVTGEVRPGDSVGDVHQTFGPGAVPAFCRTVTSAGAATMVVSTTMT